ncbi:MAG: hypothetical protein QM741_13175 [Rudaea sp.]|uniref:hypothetical protein n=1 Tax=Rudaea sp. TaxID=2136325 RepID=UPI0039E56B35
MTFAANKPDSKCGKPHTSFLPFDPADLVAMRVLPAEFARMVGVSKQSVSQWIKRGTIHLGPDGRLDPKTAAREVMRNTDPARLRARVFKQAGIGLEDLRTRVRELEDELQAEREFADRRVNGALFHAKDETQVKLDWLFCTMHARWDVACSAMASGEWERFTDEMIAVHFYDFTLADYRRERDLLDPDTPPCTLPLWQPADKNDDRGIEE